MKTNRALAVKSIKFFALTVLCMISGPFILFQAFKNTGHSWYIPVLILGIIVSLSAILLGFYSVRLLLFSFFGESHKKKP